ncbi:TonB-dependent receptor [Steroidobacter cummioxidans]|uniref:TonB-dependent receptor n=1 Tax=Steroidobacter cummioxidans TaxID=1803913 RepID=UPI000E31AD9D|nr:TonB-dependent receptor [Steroidobacter cummioxidans]
MNRLDLDKRAAALVALVAAATPVGAQNSSTAANARESMAVEEIVVTATRRSERLQDVPLSISVLSQTELTQKGIVGFEGIARETPGAVLNVASDNNVRLTARGISTNGWGAGLQTTTTIYLDELPLSTIGNTVTLNPNLYDIERVEFLRGPQGTLFGSGSLSGALRILTKSPDLTNYDASALVDLGHTPDGGGMRQRYNAMVNIPLVTDKLALRVVGFHRDEEGFLDNVGTGVKNSNTLKDSGGRAILLWEPTERMSVRLMGSYEDSQPEDASLSNPTLGERKRYSVRPDLYTSKTQIYNATVDYRFDGADLTSSSTYSIAEGNFSVDLAGTFARAIPFYLDDVYKTDTFVQELRLVSNPGERFDWVAGAFYLDRDLDLVGKQQSSPEFLAARGITGLPADATFNAFGSDTRTYELAGFGELAYHLTDKLTLTGGLRYGKYGGTLDTDAGFNTAYFTNALFGIPGALPLVPVAATSSRFKSAERTSWKASLSYEPSRDLMTYVTVSTGYRTPVYNGRAGSVSTIDSSDLVIPAGAGSDDLTNYEIGLKALWLDGKLTTNLAAYYIDWRNIQVQANRQSDSVQFATNVGRAASQGLEAEITFKPVRGLMFGLNLALNQAEVKALTAQEAAISGAEQDSRLASPRVQGSFFGTYNYQLGGAVTGFSSFQIAHVSSFPNGFPNTPGRPGVRNPLYGMTDDYTYINLQTGFGIDKMTATLYVENLGNSDAVVYIHPEAFVDSRYTILRPRTYGVRVGYQF